MNDSQSPDYLDILHSLIASRQEWEAVPEILTLTIKAISKVLEGFGEAFVEHKTLINEQSLEVKACEIQMNDKVSRKDLEGQVLTLLNYKSINKEEESASEYENLMKESQWGPERIAPPTVQELKVIATIITEKQAEEAKHQLKNDLLCQKLEIEDKMSRLRQEMNGRMQEFEKDKGELRSEYRQVQNQMGDSQTYSHVHKEQINMLQLSNRRMTEGLSHLVTHLQDNFFTKQEVNILVEREKQIQKERKQPQKGRIKQPSQSIIKSQENSLLKSVERQVGKLKLELNREWGQFKLIVMKEIGRMATSQSLEKLMESLHKQSQQKKENTAGVISRLQAKVNAVYQGTQQLGKEVLVKSQKRAEKKTSPSKPYESIQGHLLRLQKTILDQQLGQRRQMQSKIEQRIMCYDQELLRELNRRQKHLCEVIEQTYNLSTNTKLQEPFESNNGLKKLYDCNLYAKYLYIGTKECGKESCIPWEKQAYNSMPENAVWKKGSVAILIASPGLYHLTVGVFGQASDPPIVLLNGEPICELRKPPTSLSSGVKVRGATISEVFLLPAKSKLSLQMKQCFYGQAFVQLRQM